VRTGKLGGELSDERTAIDDAAAELERLSADRVGRGFVTADGLDDDALRAAVATPSREIEVGSGPGEGHSRVGGRPNLGDNDWPEDDDDEPMGFLCQIALPKGGAVAVFCTVDGHATEDEDNNCSVLLSNEDLAASPTAQPDGVPELAERVITLAEPVLEIARQTIADLGEEDPLLSKRLETLAAATEETGLTKFGGQPWYLQSAISGCPLVFQIAAENFGHEKGGWDDAGLFGVLYVFDPGDPEASWQYD